MSTAGGNSWGIPSSPIPMIPSRPIPSLSSSPRLPSSPMSLLPSRPASSPIPDFFRDLQDDGSIIFGQKGSDIHIHETTLGCGVFTDQRKKNGQGRHFGSFNNSHNIIGDILKKYPCFGKDSDD